MNFIDRFFLWLFLMPTSLYTKMGVDMLQLRAILTTKLMMDNRRPSGFSQMKRNSGEKKELSKATLGTIFGSLIMGLFFLYSFALGEEVVTHLTFYFSMFIMMLCITLITDFTSVLIDVRDNFIILPKPISDATFVTARLLHIMIRIFMVVIPLSLPAAITVTIMQGWAILPAFLLMVILSTILSIFIINAVYILILQITTPAKFQSIISYIQIGFTILIYAGYQVLPRMVRSEGILHLKLADLQYIVLYPPYWFAQATHALSIGSFDRGSTLTLFLSLFIPIVLLWVVVRYFAPSFNQKLAMITASSAEQPVVVKRPKEVSNTRVNWVERIALLLTKPGSEFMGFLFTWKMIGRSRDFKLKVYPSIGYVIVIGGMVLFNEFHSEKAIVHSEKSLMGFLLMFTYFSCFVLVAAIMQLQYSEKYKAGWIFRIAPVERPGVVLSGAIKSIMVSFYLPIVLLVTVAAIALLGIKSLPNVVLGAYNVISICTIISFISLRSLPFSQPQNAVSKGQTFIQGLLILAVPGLFGFIHWWISDYLWVVAIFILITALIPWLVFDEIKKLNWEKVKS